MIAKLRKFAPARLLAHGVERIRAGAAAWGDARRIAPESGVSALHLLREQYRLSKHYSIGRKSYYQYRLFDPALSWEEKKNYLPSGEGMAELRNLLAPPRYRCLYFNKLLFKQFFSSLGLPLAQFYGLYDPLFGRTADGRSLKNAADLSDWIQTFGAREFVVKPLEGERGLMVLVFAGRAPDDPDAVVTLGGEKYDAERLAAFVANKAALKALNPKLNAGAFLIEERIRQHPDLAALLGETLCCVRVVTIVALDGVPRIVAAVFKAQPGSIGVDHLLYGAVGCWVDLDSGALGRGRTHGDLAFTSVIPGTDTSFVGFRLPHWAEVKDLALRAAAAFPWARGIGWDVAIAEDGPVLIEGNPAWAPSLVQMPAPHGLMTGELRALYEALGRGAVR